jgi:hypothetical protein
MKSYLRSVFGVMLVLAAAGAVFAMSDEKVEAKIPFQFTVHNKAMAAGDYEVYDSSTAETGSMVIRLTKGGVEETFLVEPTEALEPAAKTELVFDVVGTKHFLRQIWIVGEKIGQQIAPCKAEQELLGKGTNKSERRVSAQRTMHHSTK